MRSTVSAFDNVNAPWRLVDGHVASLDQGVTVAALTDERIAAVPQ